MPIQFGGTTGAIMVYRYERCDAGTPTLTSDLTHEIHLSFLNPLQCYESTTGDMSGASENQCECDLRPQAVRRMTLRHEQPFFTDRVWIFSWESTLCFVHRFVIADDHWVCYSDSCDLRWQRENMVHAEVLSSWLA
jgi:hypothetical protein